MVDSYSFGRIKVGGTNYTSDIILFPDRVFAPWWRKEGHHLCLEDLEEIPLEGTDTLIVGTGFLGVMKVGNDVRAFMKDNGIQLFVEKTKDAVRIYNEMEQQGKVVGAFHLTC
jgi:hypothetical protein